MGRRLGYALSAVVVVALVALYSVAERHTVVRERGFVGPARRDPLLALERTCAALGAEVRVGLPERLALSAEDTVLVLGTGALLGEVRVRALLRWVAEEGGRLVVVVPSQGTYRRLLEAEAEAVQTRDPLLLALDVQVHEWRKAALDHEPFAVVAPSGESFDVVLPRRLHLYPASGDWEDYSPAPSEDGADGECIQVLHLRHGAGRIALYAESTWLENGGLGAHDHAELAWAEVAPDTSSGALWIEREGRVPGIGAWLVGSGWPVLAAGLLLGVLSLWRVTRRFGPPEPELPRDRRDFGEHLDAVGRLLWRTDATQELLAPLRAELRARIATLRREWADLDDERLAFELARASGRPPAEIHAALAARRHTTPQEFTRTVQCLRALRGAL